VIVFGIRVSQNDYRQNVKCFPNVCVLFSKLLALGC